MTKDEEIRYQAFNAAERLEYLELYYSRPVEAEKQDSKPAVSNANKNIQQSQGHRTSLHQEAKRPNEIDWNLINQIPIIDLLASRGVYPASDRNAKSVLYKSPLREDNNPSFGVYQNRWTDFATGDRGSVIDLVMKLDNCSNIEAAKYLMEANFTTALASPPPHISTTKESHNSGIILDQVDDIKDFRLINYLKDRKIDICVARKFCKELKYHTHNGDKKYFGIGFPNDNGGYEIRNPFFKGSTSKDISFIPNKPEKENIAVFEGFFDFLSYATINRVYPENILVLNSVINLDKAIPHLEKTKEIHCFFDRDTAGKQALAKVQELFKDKTPVIKDRSYIYEGFKDLNEFLQKQENKQQYKIQ